MEYGGGQDTVRGVVAVFLGALLLVRLLKEIQASTKYRVPMTTYM